MKTDHASFLARTARCWEFLADAAEQNLKHKVAELGRALLILHSPADATVDIGNATGIFMNARHPKSFVSLTDADRLLSRRSDAVHAANMIAAWSERSLPWTAGARAAEPHAGRGSPYADLVPSSTKDMAMQEKASDPHPLSDLAYDWITLMQNKAQALVAYDQYIKDAEAAKSPECAAFFRKVHDTDKAQLEEAKQHLVAVLQGKMGALSK